MGWPAVWIGAELICSKALTFLFASYPCCRLYLTLLNNKKALWVLVKKKKKKKGLPNQNYSFAKMRDQKDKRTMTNRVNKIEKQVANWCKIIQNCQMTYLRLIFFGTTWDTDKPIFFCRKRGSLESCWANNQGPTGSINAKKQCSIEVCPTTFKYRSVPLDGYIMVICY